MDSFFITCILPLRYNAFKYFNKDNARHQVGARQFVEYTFVEGHDVDRQFVEQHHVKFFFW